MPNLPAPKRPRASWRQAVWTTKEGTKLRLWEMSTTHLWNACRVLEETGLLIWPEVQKIQRELNSGRPSLQLRAKIVLARADKIATWIYRLRREMELRPGVNAADGLQTYDEYFSIVEAPSESNLLQPTTPQR